MMKWFRKLLEQKSKKSTNNNSLYVPMSVLNDTDKESSRVLETKNFYQEKKARHPSGTTIIRLEDINELKRVKTENKQRKSQLISYTPPTKKIYERKIKQKKEWRY